MYICILAFTELTVNIIGETKLKVETYDCPDCGLSILLRLKRQYQFKKCGRLDRKCLWMSLRRRPQLK